MFVLYIAAVKKIFPLRLEASEKEIKAQSTLINASITSILQYIKTKENNGGKVPTKKKKQTEASQISTQDSTI